MKIRCQSSVVAPAHGSVLVVLLLASLRKTVAFSGHQAVSIGPSETFQLSSQGYTYASKVLQATRVGHTTSSQLLSTPQGGAHDTDHPKESGSSPSIVDDAVTESVFSIEQATNILTTFDRAATVAKDAQLALDNDSFTATSLSSAVYTLNTVAQREREDDSSCGRCMLGICAESAQEGLATLKTWVTALHLPRGLLHGMDLDGKPLDLEGSAVYIKYNSGGVTSFAEIRKRGLDAVWKPGDAMLEEYDGPYRGVYFQVELADEEFRQFFLPLDLFCIDGGGGEP